MKSLILIPAELSQLLVLFLLSSTIRPNFISGVSGGNKPTNPGKLPVLRCPPGADQQAEELAGKHFAAEEPDISPMSCWRPKNNERGNMGLTLVEQLLQMKTHIASCRLNVFLEAVF